MSIIDNYADMYSKLKIYQPNETDKIAATIDNNKDKYQSVVKGTNIPWQLIGAIHYRESNFNFSTHIANGDSLLHRTINVPSGIIPNVKPPYTWQQSAKYTILIYKHWNTFHWDIGNLLDNAEAYNGLGYRKKGLPSPYLWSASQYYTCGKYIKDGIYNPKKIDAQIGVAPILKVMGVK